MIKKLIVHIGAIIFISIGYLFAVFIPQPTSTITPVASAKPKPTSCSVEITCPSGSKLSCSASGDLIGCEDGIDDQGFKYVQCDSDLESPPGYTRQTCTTK